MNDVSQKMLVWVFAVLQGCFLFVGTQVILRTLAMRDTLSTVQTDIARIVERQQNQADLMAVQLKNLEQRIARLEARPP